MAWSNCHRKKPYPDEDAAIEAAHQLQIRDDYNPTPGKTLNAYLCGCGKWHIGHSKKAPRHGEKITMTQVIEGEFIPEGGALVRHSGALTPVQSIEDAINLRAQIVEFTKRIMVADKDFGVIPGTGSKPTLLKPGAEKLCTHFGLFDSFQIVERTEDWTGVQHGSEPFFAYTVKCSLTRNGEVISEGVGHCNSWEKKYRYRSVYPKNATEDDKKRGRLVTKPGKGGGSYQVYLVPNDEVFDQVNTFLKMAKKRALIDATLRAVSASEFYTQDIEDNPPPIHEPEPEPEPAPKLSAKVIAEQYAAIAKTHGFAHEGNAELRYLAKLLLNEEPADVWAYQKAIQLPDDAWTAAVQKANTDIAEVKIPKEEVAAEPALVEVAAPDTTLEAMAK